MLSPDGLTAEVLEIPVELGKAMTVTATIRVSVKASPVEYKPNLGIHVDRPMELSTDSVVGNSIPVTDEAGT